MSPSLFPEFPATVAPPGFRIPPLARSAGRRTPGRGAGRGFFAFALALLPGMVPAVVADESPSDAVRPGRPPEAVERQVSRGPGGKLLTNLGAWAPDGRWIVYDLRSDAAGEVFDGKRIEAIQVETGEVRVLYESRNGASCGVVTCHPSRKQVVFIHGPEHPTPDWTYGPYHREGWLQDWEEPGRPAEVLDARDLVPPFTAGALRGGSHVHVFSADGRLVSFTYEDHVLAAAGAAAPGADLNQRNIGVSVVGQGVAVKPEHPRNHSGTAFTVLVTRTVNEPRPGSDEISKAFEEGWIGTRGYVRPDGRRQRYALAFQGHVRSARGETLSEVFVVDLPDDLTVPSPDGPLAGTATRRPLPPRGTVQRRVTFTEGRRHPGIQGPRHWLRVSPDGTAIAFLMKDDDGVVQLWTVSPNGGEPRQVSRTREGIGSTFTWSPDGRWLAHALGGALAVTDAASGATHRLTAEARPGEGPRPEACVFSPDGRRIAYIRRIPDESGRPANQIFVAELR